ncbi:MAG: NAD(P)H-binding protein [Chitinophagaceae bacterium]|nr:NAD(P)H-binding protein [Chitinophagaceae bacterium]
MKLTIFGATGTVGKQLIQQALFNGHQVKAFGRNVYTADYLPVESKIQTENLQLVQGALFDENEVFNAIKGCDAVLSAIGGASDGTDKARTLGMKNIIKQMQKAAVKRIIGIGGMGILNASDKSMLMEEKSFPPEYLPVSLEHKKAFEMLADSGLDWTFVCPPDITKEGPTGKYVTRADYPPEGNKYRINAGDLSMFMLNELTKNEFVKHRVGISN